MSRKTKINVLLPIKMVGELENMSRLGKRSEFIMKAIRSRLNNEHSYSLEDESTLDILYELKYRKDMPAWFLNQILLLITELEE